MIDILVIGFILSLFGLDDLVVDGINQLLNTTYNVSIYWLILFLIGIVVTLINSFSTNNKKDSKKKKNKNKDKSTKEIKKQIKDEEKKSNLTFAAIEYEYEFLLDRVESALREINKYTQSLAQENIKYCFKLDEYFRKVKVIRDVNIPSIEGVACLLKAILENPIFEDKEANEKLLFEIIRQFNKPVEISNLRFNNKTIVMQSKEKLIMECFEDYLKYDEDIFLMCAFILDRLNRLD